MFCNLMICRESSKLPDILSKVSTITMILFCHIQCQETGFLCCGVENTHGGVYFCQIWLNRSLLLLGNNALSISTNPHLESDVRIGPAKINKIKRNSYLETNFFKKFKLLWNNNLLVTHLLGKRCQPLLCLIVSICQWLIRNRYIFC